MDLISEIIARAKANKQRIVLPEGTEEDARSEVRHGVRQLLRRRGKWKRVPLQPDGELPAKRKKL